MPAIPRQKACIACADSKRRCDKQLPECQRCLDRDQDCVYPQVKRRRKDTGLNARHGRAEGPPVLHSYANADALGSGLDFGDWGALGAAGFDVPLEDVIIPHLPPPPAPEIDLSAQGVAPESSNVSITADTWFLRDETWVMQHSNIEPGCVAAPELEPFIRTVEKMLQCWVRDGCNSFIHRRLYEKGMPTCLQDAFTTLAAHTSRTPAVKETIMQIALERSSALARQHPPTTTGALGIKAHLARVQALFVYEFILIFDGSVRLRASAEQQLPTLRQWVVRMWEVGKQYRGQHGSPHDRPLHWTASEFDREYDATTEMWRLWILTECVRRTHLIIDSILNIYQMMTKGWAECSGAVMITARRGLWEAESSMKWFELCSANSPLLVPSLQPGPLISHYAAEEIDEFAIMIWTFIVGTDKIQCWMERSNRTIRT
ncbi:hypothetical protein F5Y19DRAFT_356882 [Xylariaceae sp. FL1651]|nr:hypothetical protein F5Y19DRAFT_356882 [Xylariaceae sp. FL1651]